MANVNSVLIKCSVCVCKRNSEQCRVAFVEGSTSLLSAFALDLMYPLTGRRGRRGEEQLREVTCPSPFLWFYCRPSHSGPSSSLPSPGAEGVGQVRPPLVRAVDQGRVSTWEACVWWLKAT